MLDKRQWVNRRATQPLTASILVFIVIPLWLTGAGNCAFAQQLYQVRGTVRVGSNPVGVVAGAGGFYVANYGGSTVSRVDPKSLRVSATITVGKGPYGVALLQQLDQSRSLLFVTNQRDNTVSVFDEYTSKITAVLPVGRLPHGVAATTYKAYVANAGDNSVTVITPRSASTFDTKTISKGIGSFPTAVAARWDPGGRHTYIFVTNTGSNTISVIEGDSDTVVSTINTFTNYPIGAAAIPTFPRCFIANQRINTVSEIDSVTHQVVSTVTVGSEPIGVAVRYPVDPMKPQRFDVIVANSRDNTVTVLQRDFSTNTQSTKTIRVGNGPIGVSASGYVAVTNYRDNTVTILY